VDAQGGKGHVRGVDIFKVTEDGLICEKLSYAKG